MEAIKAMIHDQDLPMHLWAEATRTAIYVQNRISRSALGNKTPKEMFTGEKPEVSHLRYSFVMYTYMFQRRRYQSWTLQGRREYLCDTMNNQKLIESIIQDFSRSRSVEMLHLMKMNPSLNPKISLQMKIMKKRRRLLEPQKVPYQHLEILKKILYKKIVTEQKLKDLWKHPRRLSQQNQDQLGLMM